MQGFGNIPIAEQRCCTAQKSEKCSTAAAVKVADFAQKNAAQRIRLF